MKPKIHFRIVDTHLGLGFTSHVKCGRVEDTGDNATIERPKVTCKFCREKMAVDDTES